MPDTAPPARESQSLNMKGVLENEALVSDVIVVVAA